MDAAIAAAIAANPNRDKILSEIQIYLHATREADDVDPEPEEEGWVRFPLCQGGPLALALMATDPLFAGGGSVALQKNILREALTDLQAKSPGLLKGRKWPQARVSEALGSCLGRGKEEKLAPGEEPPASPWNDLCFLAICELMNLQIIRIDQEKKVIVFFPANICTWSREIPVYCMDADGKHIFGFGGSSEQFKWPVNHLGGWISRMEEREWKVDWPVADGKMNELNIILEEAGLAIIGKMKKEELARKAGKVKAIKILAGWTTGPN